MPRILIALLALLSLTSAARSDTPPNLTSDFHATLFSHARSDNHFLHSVAPHTVPVALACCKICSPFKACGNT